MSTTPPHPHSDRRTEALHAARALLAVHGIDGVTMQAVAQSIGVAAPGLYRHFEDRADLLAQLYDDVADDLLTHVRAGCARHPDDDPAGQLYAASRALFDWGRAHRRELDLLIGSPLDGTAARDASAHVFGRLSAVFHRPRLRQWATGSTRIDRPVTPALVTFFTGARTRVLAAVPGLPQDVPLEVFQASLSNWQRLFGLLCMTVYDHLGAYAPTADDDAAAANDAYLDALFDDLVERCLHRFGLPLTHEMVHAGHSIEARRREPEEPAETLRTRRERLTAALRRDATDAARSLLAEHGPAGVTVAAVADRLRVSAAGLYRHFDGPAALLRAVHDHVLDELLHQMRAAADRQDRADHAAKMYAADHALFCWSLDHRGEFHLLMSAGFRLAPSDEPPLTFQRIGALFVPHIHSAWREGQAVVPDDALRPALIPHLESTRQAMTAGLPDADELPLRLVHSINLVAENIWGLLTIMVHDHLSAGGPVEPSVLDALFADLMADAFADLGITLPKDVVLTRASLRG